MDHGESPAGPLLLREGDRKKLQRLVRSTSVRAGLAQRVRLVLLAAEGVYNTEIAEKVGTTRTTVIAWRARYPPPGSKDWLTLRSRVGHGGSTTGRSWQPPCGLHRGSSESRTGPPGCWRYGWASTTPR